MIFMQFFLFFGIFGTPLKEAVFIKESKLIGTMFCGPVINQSEVLYGNMTFMSSKDGIIRLIKL